MEDKEAVDSMAEDRAGLFVLSVKCIQEFLKFALFLFRFRGERFLTGFCSCLLCSLHLLRIIFKLPQSQAKSKQDHPGTDS